jgi:lysophospholipase L1-like esterase
MITASVLHFLTYEFKARIISVITRLGIGVLSIFCITPLVVGAVENPILDFVDGPFGKLARITWPSEIGACYAIEKSPDLQGDWSQFDWQQATTTQTAIVDTDALTPRCFYRIKEERFSEVAFFGDSITDQSSFNDSETPQALFYLTGYACWARSYLENRFESIQRLNSLSQQDFGYSGAKIADMRSGASYLGVQPMAVLLARNPKVVVEMLGTNDVINYYDATAAGIATTRTALWDELLAGGVKRIVALAIPPTGLENAPGATARTILSDAANELLQTAASSRAVTWVPYPALLKSDGKADLDYFRDGIHPNHSGAEIIGQAVATALNPHVTQKSFDMPPDGDVRWLTGNPYMTGGTTIATGWESWWGMAGVTASKVTDAEGTWQRLVVSGITENSTGAPDFGIWRRVAGAPVVKAGTKIRAVARFRASGFRGIRFGVVQDEENKLSGFSQGAGFAANANYPTACNDSTLTWVGPIITVNPTDTALNIWISPFGNGTLDMRQCGVIQVP